MGRCWGCCQENCGYTNCSCSCHRGENLKPAPVVTLKEVELDRAEDPKSLCPKCNHPMWEHRFSYPEKDRKGYGCFERLSYDNNDFCGCTHGAPPKQKFVFYAVADDDDLQKAKWYCTYSSQKSSGWKKDFEDAKIWVRRSAAKAKATALGAQARIVEFHVDKTVVIDQREHLKKVAEEKIQRQKKRLEAEHQAAVKRAHEELERALARLENLKGKSK